MIIIDCIVEFYIFAKFWKSCSIVRFALFEQDCINCTKYDEILDKRARKRVFVHILY